MLLWAVLASAMLPGCIVQDIHDRMEETSLAMAEANRNLETVSEQLAEANRVLDSRLAQIELTNEHLNATRERLQILESIDGSLKALDLHLASLRRTLDNIDSTIPFLNLADPAEDEPAADPAADPGVAAPRVAPGFPNSP